MTDLTVITNVMLADGIGRQGIGLINCLKNDLSINVMKMQPCSYAGINLEIITILNKPLTEFGKVSFWTYILGINDKITKIHKLLNSEIKIAYSMFESDAIPKLWVNILNSYYDIVVVPDKWLIDVYKKSGVIKPIFVLPLGIIIDNLLNKPLKSKINNTFTFGLSASFHGRKNHIKVLNSFKKIFGNDPKFQLNLHGRFGPIENQVKNAVTESNLKNVKLYCGAMSPQQYDSFMENIDCYIFPSGGEGFSITPREVLALGIPCILSNNTAHKTICETGLVIPLKSEKKIPAIYEVFGNKQIGNFFDYKEEDLIKLMKDVIDNYGQYLEQSNKGREWVKQYTWDNLKNKYINLFKPKNIILSKENLITEDKLETNDSILYKKLIKVYGKNS